VLRIKSLASVTFVTKVEVQLQLVALVKQHFCKRSIKATAVDSILSYFLKKKKSYIVDFIRN